MHNEIKVLDHGYVRLIECWGHGDAGQQSTDLQTPEGGTVYYPDDYECGIIEAARQSTQGSFRGWTKSCFACKGHKTVQGIPCMGCQGMGEVPEDEKLLAYLYNNRHATPFEFSGMVIEVKAPIMVFREWHRHRTQSYNEMSARYAPLPDTNYMPTPERCLVVSGTNKQAGAMKWTNELTHESALKWLENLDYVYRYCENVYQDGLKRGIPKELARLCVPVGRYSQMRASTCLRNWLAFMTLRADPQAQWEIRQFAEVVGTIIEQQFPQTWKLFDSERKKVKKQLKDFTNLELTEELAKRRDQS